MRENISIRKGKPGDEKGINNLMREGLRRNNWNYTGENKATKEHLEKIRKNLKSSSPNSYYFVALDNETNKIIGNVSFSFQKVGRLSHRIELAWGLNPDYQGKGIATRLLRTALRFAKEKGFKRAEAEMAMKNTPSWKLAQKLGFKIEGTKRKALLTDDGKYIDTYVVGKILK